MPNIWNVQAPFFNLFARWDSAYYIFIAKYGYATDLSWAFRPLFPSLLSTFTPFSPPFYVNEAMVIAGFFLNNVLFLLALHFVHDLTARLFSEKIADDSVLFLAFCPAAIFFTAIYPESLYIFLIAVSFLFLEKGNMFKSGIVGYLAGLTRPEGIFASLIVSIKTLLTAGTTKNRIKGLVAASIVLTSVLTVCVLAWAVRGNFQIIFSIELSWGSITLFQALSNPSLIIGQHFFAFFAISIPFAAISILTIFPFFVRKRPKKILKDSFLPYYFCSAFLILFFLATGEIRSLPRYFSTIIPIYWGLALWVEKKSFLKPLILLIFSIQLAFGTILFVNWYYFI